MTETLHLDAGGRTVQVSNSDRVLWPEAGFTKGEMAAYYLDIAPVLLPHVAGRPMVLARFPDGVDGTFWFQTQCHHPPEWVRTTRIAKATKPGQAFDYCVIDDAASLVWAANLSGIELHPLLSRAGEPDVALEVVFDLDPGVDTEFARCCEVAVILRDELDQAGLSAYPKVTGASGLHVHAPLAGESFEATKELARAIARSLLERRPGLVVDHPGRERRSGKVFIDWAQNNPLRSTIAPYSLRGMPWPTVAAPVAWDEIEAWAGDEQHAPAFLPADVLERVVRLGDLFEPMLSRRQRLPQRARD